MKKLMITVVAAVVAAVSFGETISLTLTKDCTFAEALAAYNTAQDPATTYVDTDGGTSLGANDVEVSGAFKMTMTKALANWTGNLVVKAGAIVYGQSDGTTYATVLGSTSAGKVTVESGATLQLRTNSSNNENKLGRPVYIAGTGVGNTGALRLSTTTNIRAMWPKNIYLNGDALITRLGTDSAVNGGTVVTSGTHFYLQNHVLTFGKSSAEAGLNFILEDPYLTTGGTAAGVVIDSGSTLGLRYLSHWDGYTSNFIKAIGSGKLGAQGDFTVSAKWRLIFDTTTAMDPGNYQAWPTDDNALYRSWDGPATLMKPFYVSCDNAYANQLSFVGKVSGAGSIGLNSAKGVSYHSFNLCSGENDFTGGLGSTNYLLRLHSPTAVPSGDDAGPMLLKGGELDLNYVYTKGAFKFPDTTFEGAGKIYSKVKADSVMKHAGEFKSLTKKGSGELEIDARLAGGALNVAGGSVKLPALPTQAEQKEYNAGLIYGQSGAFASYASPFSNSESVDIGWGKKPLKDVAPYIVYANSTVNGLTIFSHPHGDFISTNPWQSNFYQKLTVYNGVLWNNSSEAKTIKVICTLNAYVQLTIGSTVKYNSEPSRNMSSAVQKPKGEWEFTVQPGANYFDVRAFDRYGMVATKDGGTGPYFYFGNICTNGLSNWDDTHGLVWTTKTDSKDLNDYHRFEEAGTDFKFTKVDVVPEVQQLDTLTGSGALNLNGGTLEVDELVWPLPTVTNGKVVGGVIKAANATSLALPANYEVRSVNVTSAVTPKSRNEAAGVVYGYEESNNAEYIASKKHNGYVDMNKYGWTIRTNGGTIRMPYDFYLDQFGKDKHNSWSLVCNYGKNAYRTYAGYIWNDEPTNCTWTFMSTIYNYQQLKINGVAKRFGGGNAPTGGAKPEPFSNNFTLKPGANYFEAVYGNQYVSAQNGIYNFGVVATNNVANWDVNRWQYGMYVDRKGRGTKDVNDYEVLSINEPLTTLTSGLTTDFSVVDLGSGKTFDLSTHDNSTSTLKGATKFENGTMTVEDIWHLSAADVLGGVYAENVAFGEGCTIKFDATLASIYAAMKAKSADSILLATGVTGSAVPKLARAAGDKRTWMKLVLTDGNLYLVERDGMMIYVK